MIESVRALSFVSKSVGENGKPASLWEVKESGDWQADNERGKKIGEECLNYMANQGNPGFLHHLVKAIGEKGRYGGVEVGFFTYIGAAAIQ